MNRRFLLALAAAVCFGLLAIFIVQKILVTKMGVDQQTKVVSVIFAKSKIAAGTTITESQLKTGIYQRADLPEGTLLEAKQVIGKIATNDIEANLPITNKNLATLGQNLSISEEKRAITIRVDEASGVAGFATPGSYVDVIAVMTPGGNARQISTVVAQNLRVLANGQQTQVKNDGTNKMGNSVTLEVTPAQAEVLTLSMREGSLHLILRNPANKDSVSVPPVQISNLMDVPDRTTTAATQPPPSRMQLPPSSPKPTATPVLAPSPGTRLAVVKVYEGTKETSVTVRQ